MNTYKPLIIPFWLGGGAFFIFLFRQFFKGIPKEMEEAVRPLEAVQKEIESGQLDEEDLLKRLNELRRR